MFTRRPVVTEASKLGMPVQSTLRTRDNTAIVLIDYQVGLLTGMRGMRLRALRHNVRKLALAAKALGLPIIAITTASDNLWGPTIPELKSVLGRGEIMDRSTVNPWDFPPFVEAVTAANRAHLIMAGLDFEGCVSLLAISVRQHGFQPVVALDACGTFTAQKRVAGIERLTALGIEICGCALLLDEINADDADPI